jgi:hypothetical protein
MNDTDYSPRRPLGLDEIFVDPSTGKVGRVIGNQTDLAHYAYLKLKFANGEEGLVRYEYRRRPTIEEKEAFERAEKTRN